MNNAMSLNGYLYTTTVNILPSRTLSQIPWKRWPHEQNDDVAELRQTSACSENKDHERCAL